MVEEEELGIEGFIRRGGAEGVPSFLDQGSDVDGVCLETVGNGGGHLEQARPPMEAEEDTAGKGAEADKGVHMDAVLGRQGREGGEDDADVEDHASAGGAAGGAEEGEEH